LDEAEVKLMPAARDRAIFLGTLAESAPLLTQSLKDLEALKTEADGLVAQEKVADEISNRIGLGEKKVAEHEAVVARCRAEYERLDEALAGDQAAALAHRLKDGEPCPVCGSAEHPGKAVAHGGPGVNRDAVKQAQADWKSKEDELGRYRNKLTELVTKRESLREENERARKALFQRGYVDASDLLARIRDARVKVEGALSAARELAAARARGRARGFCLERSEGAAILAGEGGVRFACDRRSPWSTGRP
jgi:exonuclease SbcC